MVAMHRVKKQATAGEGVNIVVARVIYIIFAIIVAIIFLRMVLLLFGAEASQPFAQLVYDTSLVFVAPFFFVFGYTPTYGAPVFEISSVVAFLIYILLGWGLAVMVTMGSWHSDEV